jgi:hypothetical protein
MGTPRLLVTFTLATLLVVLMVAALATRSWVVLGIALLVHLTATAITVGMIRRYSTQADKPDPTTEARREVEEREAGDRSGDDEPRMAI